MLKTIKRLKTQKDYMEISNDMMHIIRIYLIDYDIINEKKYTQILNYAAINYKFYNIFITKKILEYREFLCNKNHVKYKFDITTSKFQSKKTCLIAIRKNPLNLQYVIDQTKEIIYNAVKRNKSVIKYITNPTEDIYKYLIKQNPFWIKYIDNPSKDLIIYTINLEPKIIINNNKNIPEDILMYVLNKDPSLFKYIHNPPLDICISLIKHNPIYIGYIKNKSYRRKCRVYIIDNILPKKFNLEFYKKYPCLINYLEKYPSEDILIKLVQDNGLNIKYINNKYITYDIKKIAIEQNPKAETYIVNNLDLNSLSSSSIKTKNCLNCKKNLVRGTSKNYCTKCQNDKISCLNCKNKYSRKVFIKTKSNFCGRCYKKEKSQTTPK